jgi:hypothetical protein
VSCCRIADPVRFAVFMLLLIVGQAGAAEYYIDSELGDDSYSGMQALPDSGAGPWRTLGRIASASIQPGDRVLLKCGAVWNETPVLKLKGSAEAPVTLATYGDCAGRRPLLRPASSVLLPESFRAESTGWSAPHDELPGMVYATETTLPRARYPAHGWLRLKASGAAARIAPDDLPVAAASLAGTDWVVRTNDYTVESRRIYGLGLQGDALVAKPFAFKPGPGAGYFLEGQPWMLGASEGWAYDPASRRLFVRQRPSGPIGVNSSLAGLALEQPEYVRIQGLAIRFVAGVGVDISGGRDIELNDLDIADVGLAFVRAREADNVRVTKLRARRSQQDGIVLHRGANASVTDSLIEDVGVSDNLRKSIAAILVDSMSSAVVARNRIARTGYAAIMFGSNAVVEDNAITQACMKLADCGAIYTSGARKNYGHYASRIVDNLISDVPGNLDGAVGRAALTAGIYLDDDTRGIEVTGNFVEKAQRGIFSKAASSVIARNTLFDNEYGIRVSSTGAYGEGARASEIDDNYIVSKLGQMSFLVSAEAHGKSVVLLHNRVRSLAGALPSQVWHGSVRQANPTVSDSGRVGRAFSLANTSDVRQSYPCPLPRPECLNLRLPDGAPVSWPVDLMPGKALVLSRPEQS